MARAYLDRWEERWADTRIHGTTKRQVSAMFAEEKPSFQPLPIEPFRYYQYGERAVHLDGCVEVEAAYYSAPPHGVDAGFACKGPFCTGMHTRQGELAIRRIQGILSFHKTCVARAVQEARDPRGDGKVH